MNILAFLTSYKSKKAELDRLTDELEGMKKEILAYTGTHAEPDEKGKLKLVIGQYTVTVTPCEKHSIDEKALREKHPELIPEFERVTPYNRMIVK